MASETIADIVAAVRNEEFVRTVAAVNDVSAMRELLHALADRIEAAWERERQPLTIAEWIDKEESIADIVAVLRRYVLPSLAERLEAAWKREKAEAESDALAVGGIVEAARTTGKSSAVGNAAAMREALGEIVFDCLYAIEGISDESDYGRSYLSRVLGKARAALSKPARNCDLFATVSNARKAFNEWLKHNTPISFGGWLLRLADERKGEGDGSK